MPTQEYQSEAPQMCIDPALATCSEPAFQQAGGNAFMAERIRNQTTPPDSLGSTPIDGVTDASNAINNGPRLAATVADTVRAQPPKKAELDKLAAQRKPHADKADKWRKRARTSGAGEDHFYYKKKIEKHEKRARKYDPPKPKSPVAGKLQGGLDAFGTVANAQAIAQGVDDAAAWMDGFLGLRYAPDAPPAGSLLAAARERPRRLRIRRVTDHPLVAVDPEHVAATEAAGAQLAALGHTVEPGPMLPDVTVEDFLPLYGFLMGKAPIVAPSKLEPCTRWVREQGAGWSPEAVRAHAAELVARIERWWGDVDVVLSPTTAIQAPPIGAWQGLSGRDTFYAAVGLGAFTAGYNIGGQAAASVPWGTTSAGLPIGVQLACPQGQDALLLSLCRELMASTTPGHSE